MKNALEEMILFCAERRSTLTPALFSFDAMAVTIDGERFECENPRLAFARILAVTFEDNNDGIPTHDGGWIGRCVKANDGAFIGQGCVIGSPGFGYVRDGDTLVPMPHRAGVVIESGVIIHSKVCIDRGVVTDTFIGEGTKIDNFVHVAHNCRIGKNCLIVAHATLGGGVEIGDNSFIGMGARIKQKVKIGKNVVIGMGAVVLHDVPDGETWVGNPARKLR